MGSIASSFDKAPERTLKQNLIKAGATAAVAPLLEISGDIFALLGRVEAIMWTEMLGNSMTGTGVRVLASEGRNIQ